MRDLELALDGPIDLVTTSSLLDLVSAEWVERLEHLIDHPELRSAFGNEARSRVEQSYSAQVWAPRVGEILRGATARPSSRPSRSISK